MEMLSLGSLFVGGWSLACTLLLVGVIATWIYRIPGTTLSDFMHGPKGQHAPRLFHSAADALRLVRPEKRRLIYGLQLAGASIAAFAIAGLFLVSLVFPEASK